MCPIGNHPTGDDVVTNSEFQETREGRQNQNQNRHCCCVHVSSQCPSDRNSPFTSNNNGGFGGQPRVKSTSDSFDDGIAVRIVNDVSIDILDSYLLELTAKRIFSKVR